MYVGRYAPSPTGDLHLGNALAAVCAWARARRAGGRLLLRMEDLDRARVVVGAAENIVQDLRALGVTWDGDVLVQSHGPARYADALDRLRARGLVYACRCSRKDLARAASAPHEGDEGPPYPGTCRVLGLDLDDPAHAWRFLVPPGTVRIDDALQGTFAHDVLREVGDFVVKRKDGVIAYQLAVVVDDIHQGVTEVVRGRDLLSSAPRQALLFRALKQEPPAFAHTPLWVDAHGRRLSKRSGGDDTVRALLARGVDVVGLIARALGVDAKDLVALADQLEDRVLARATVV